MRVMSRRVAAGQLPETNEQKAVQAGPDQKRHPKQRTFLFWSAENAKINLGVKKQLSLRPEARFFCCRNKVFVFLIIKKREHTATTGFLTPGPKRHGDRS